MDELLNLVFINLNILFVSLFLCLLRGKVIKHQLSVAGLDEAEAFGDVELMAEFSLLSVVQNLQQGKMGPNLLETLEVLKHELLHPDLAGNHLNDQIG